MTAYVMSTIVFRKIYISVYVISAHVLSLVLRLKLHLMLRPYYILTGFPLVKK